MLRKHDDLKFIALISKLKPKDFELLVPQLNDKAIDTICSFLNYLLQNPREPKFKNRRKLKKLVLDNEDILKQIASDRTAGKIFKKKRKVLYGGFGASILSILTAAIPAILSSIKT